LAAARRPEQGEELTGSHVERDVVDGEHVAEPLLEVVEADLGRSCAGGSRHRAGRYAAGPRCAPTSPALWNTGPPGADGRPHRDGRGPAQYPRPSRIARPA